MLRSKIATFTLALALLLGGCGKSEPGSDSDGGPARGDASRADGSSADASSADGAEGHDADGSDGGPACANVTPLPAATLTLEASCASPTACGGAIDGTGWELDSLCVDGDFAGRVRSICSAATIGQLSTQASGSAVFVGGKAELRIDARAEAQVTLPNACTGCRCSDQEARLSGAGLIASCNPVCNGGDCTCSVRRTVSLEDHGTYSSSTATIRTSAGQALGFCRQASGLTLAGGGAFGSASFHSVPASPEVCDGRDNDLDGLIDEDPEDCSPCSRLGVCAGAVSEACENGQWVCRYTSPDYEPAELSCDRLDNDCNGVVDDGPRCGPEICDGFDNDGDGMIDNDPTDSPCSSVGVCAQHVATCMGAAGWSCVYTSTAYEPQFETRCDHLDNDCNGMIDEHPNCREICDGQDNDVSGVIDDHLIDTPLCPTSGVCAGGGTPICGGAAGWSCRYSAATHEAVETRCDGLDNDCDGVVDEPCMHCSAAQSLLVADQIIDAGGSYGVEVCRFNLATHARTPLAPLPMGAEKVTLDEPRAKIYFVVGNAIQRANLDGTGLQTIFTTTTAVNAIAIDPSGSWVYFSDWLDPQNAIWRVRISNSALELVRLAHNPRDLAMTGDQLYAFEDCTSPPAAPTVSYCLYRSGLDGSAPIQIARSPWNILSPLVDVYANRVYFQEDFQRIRSAALDGLNDRLLVQAVFRDDPAPLAVDPWAGWIYYGMETITRRIRVDGTSDQAFDFACSSGSRRILAAARSGCVP